jgi:ParB family transcriptional regulator, chromosome partitioning protein
MSKRHDALFDDVLSGLGAGTQALEDAGQDAGQAGAERPANRFRRRSSALAEHASGSIVEKTLRWVDPARCRMWARHNRRYDLLDERGCADLIEGILAQGGQEFPAIVRPLAPEETGGQAHDWEVICGARRHWTTSWLRANGYPRFRFLIEVRDLTDEEAFRVADVENRDRRDISDYERAVDYAAACRFYYGGHQGRMAARLEVSNAWLSRYLDLARLPVEIVRAYGHPAELREFHARRLKPVLADEAARARVLDAARALADTQAARRAADEAPLSGANVLSRLLVAARSQAPGSEAPAPAESRRLCAEDGSVVMQVVRRRGGGVGLTLVPGAARADLEQAFARLLDEHAPDGVLGSVPAPGTAPGTAPGIAPGIGPGTA